MKITAFLILASCLHVSASVVSQTVSFSGRDVPLEKVFDVIEKQTGYVVYYTTKQIRQSKPVTVDAKNIALNEFLMQALRHQPLGFSIKEKTVFINLKEEELKRASILPVIETPPINVRGRVLNEKGEPVAASILVKGTDMGVTTDSYGNFEINGIDDNSILIISGIGVETQEIKIKGRSNLDISAVTKIGSEEEVVIKAGYYDVKKREATGNISKVSGKEIQKNPVGNVLAALPGRVPGLEITQSTGVPGGNFQVRIRGRNSIENGNDPLYIIDGVPFLSSTMAFRETSQSILGVYGTSPLNAINPADIESIEVLKDADATAIYGSRGANGVILINTKKGAAGKTKIDFNFYTGAGKVASKMDLLSTPQYLEMRREALQNSGLWPLDTAWYKYIPDVFIWDTTRYTDWQKELIGKTAVSNDAQLTFSGGERTTQYSFGIGYHKEGAVFPGDNSDRRISTHFTLNNSGFNDRLKTSFSIKYSVNNTDLISQDLTGLALRIPPDAPPLYNSDGGFNWSNDPYTKTWVYPYADYPLGYLKTGYESNTNNLLLNSVLSYKILFNLEIKANLGYTNVTSEAVTLTPKSSLEPSRAASWPNASVFSNSTFRNWVAEPQLNWKPKIGDGVLDVLLGSTLLDQLQDGVAQYAEGFTSEALMKNISAATNRVTGSNIYNQYRYIAGFGRINYAYKGAYIINITGRRDGSSRFGSGKQFSNFGAIGAAWILSETDYFKNWFPFFSFAKIRASYGVTGNDQIPNYEYLDTYRPSGNYLDVMGLTPVRLANPEFAWEKNKKLEVNLDVSFLNNRINGSISYYNNKSSNQLVVLSLPPTTGFEGVRGNLPAVVRNNGIEVQVNTVNIESNNFSWNTSVNFSVPRNKLISFPGLEESPTYANTLVVGRPLNILKLYQYTGVNPQTGLYEFEDVNKDGNLDYQDKQVIRFIGSKSYGGLQNTFQYKGLQVDILFQFVKQELINYLGAFWSGPGASSNQPTLIMDRWRKPGDISDIQKFSITEGYDTYSNLQSSDRDVSDASFIRLKNLSISYTMPKEWLSKAHITNARIFLQGQNLLTFTNYNGLDPESGSAGLPPLKVLSAGIQLTL